MTEISAPWDGIVTGHCGPYSSDEWGIMLGNLTILDPNYGGVLWGFVADTYGSGASITVHDGGATIRGRMYQLSPAAGIIFPVASPTASRTDRIVLRSDWTAQTITMEYLENPVEETGTPPALTQINGDVWEIPLWTIDVTSVPAITVTDDRERALPTMRQVSDGSEVAWPLDVNAGSALTWYDLPNHYDLWVPWTGSLVISYMANFLGPLTGASGHVMHRLKVERVGVDTTYLESVYDTGDAAGYWSRVYQWAVSLYYGSYIITPQIYRSTLASPDNADLLYRRLHLSVEPRYDLVGPRM